MTLIRVSLLIADLQCFLDSPAYFLGDLCEPVCRPIILSLTLVRSLEELTAVALGVGERLTSVIAGIV